MAKRESSSKPISNSRGSKTLRSSLASFPDWQRQASNASTSSLLADPSSSLLLFSAASNGVGASKVALPIPDDLALAGDRLFAQFFWPTATAPAPCPPLGLSASNALDIAFQP